MNNILSTICEKKRAHIASQKLIYSLSDIEELARSATKVRGFSDKINLKFLDNKNSFTEDDWSEIYNLSLKTYVDESDKSRERTAGAGLTDND